MLEIKAQYYTSDMRLCQMPVKMFDGFVRIKDSETIEDGTQIETREYFRRVLSEPTIKRANRFRSEVSRAVNAAGFKVPSIGMLVDGRGLDALKDLESNAKTQAEEIRELMLQDLAEHGEDEKLAKCEVDLIALMLHPDDEFTEQVGNMISEAVSDKFTNDTATLNRVLAQTLTSLEAGHSLVALRKLAQIGRFITKLRESGSVDETEINAASDDLIQAKSIVSSNETKIENKIIELKKLKLFDGIKVLAQVAGN